MNERLPKHLAALKDRVVDYNVHYNQEEYIFYHQDTPLAAAGDLVLIYGLPKSRKSLMADMIVGSVYNPGDYMRTCHFRLELPMTKPILHLDAEMDISRTQKTRKKLFEWCNNGVCPDNYKAINIKGFPPHHKIDQLSYLGQDSYSCIIIDQFGKFVRKYNDEDQAGLLLDTLEDILANQRSLIIGLIHSNRFGEDSNGVVGSYLDKETSCSIRTDFDKNTNLTKVVHVLSRERLINPFYFRHDAAGLPLLVGEDDLDVAIKPKGKDIFSKNY